MDAFGEVTPLKIFMGIGGGSDIDTCELLETAYKRLGAGVSTTSSSTKTACILSLGPKFRGISNGTTPSQQKVFDSDATISSAKSKGFQSISDRLFRIPSSNHYGMVVFHGDDVPYNKQAELLGNLIADYIVPEQCPPGLSNRLRANVDISNSDPLKQADAAGPGSAVSLIAVDTGGDVLGTIFEKHAECDMVLDEDSNSLVPIKSGEEGKYVDITRGEEAIYQNPYDDISRPDSRPEEAKSGDKKKDPKLSRPIIMLKKGQLYIPYGKGFGDLSNVQFGPINEARDQYSIQILNRFFGIGSPDKKTGYRLCALGIGSDGETSVEGLRNGYEVIKAKIDVEVSKMGEFFVEEDFNAVKKWKTPTENKTPWIIRKGIAENGLIYAERGASMVRRLKENGQPAYWQCVMPSDFLQRIWFFSDKDFLARL